MDEMTRPQTFTVHLRAAQSISPTEVLVALRQFGANEWTVELVREDATGNHARQLANGGVATS